MKLLENKHVLITGCRKGIGRATLEKFASHGASIWAHVRSMTPEFQSDAAKTASKYGVDIHPIGFDLNDEDAVKAGLKEILQHKKPIDILVNNAGILPESRLFPMTPIQQVRDVMQTNFISAIFLTQLISRCMIRQKDGVILFLASVAGLNLDGDTATFEYSASKAALVATVKKLARELAPFHIRVNAVAPGLVETEMVRSVKESFIQQTIEATLLKRPGKPEEVADALLFLASNMASFITGEVLRVDGGR